MRELERERVTVQQAAARLGITESAVRKRARKGDIRSEKVLEGNRERLYVFLDPDAEPFPEPFREKYMRSLEGRVKTLEDEVMRQQAIILSMSQSLRALTGAPQAPQDIEEAQEEAEPRPSTGGAEQETMRPPATSAPTSRLGMSDRALAVGGIATFLAWVNASWALYVNMKWWFAPFDSVALMFALPVLVPLLSGLWAGSTKRPSFPWFSSPHRWLLRSGRSVLRTALFAVGIPAWVAFFIVVAYFTGRANWGRGFFGWELLSELLSIPFYSALVSLLALLPFMSGAFLGNALRRVGLLGTPKEPLQGEEEGEREEEVWSPRKEARWGIAGTILAALISAVASVVAAALS